MTHVLAAEGGYQTFHLSGGEWADPLASALTALLAIVVGFVLDARRARRGRGHPEDEGDRGRDPGGRDGVPQAPVQDDQRHPDPARGHRVPHVDGGEEGHARGRPRRCRCARQSGTVPHARVHRRLLHVGPHRLHRHEPGRARQRAHRGRGPMRVRCRRRCRSRSAPVASPACSPSASACSGRRSSS